MPEECDKIDEDVYLCIIREREYQRFKFGEPEHCPAEWILILEKLVSDARSTFLNHGNFDAMGEIRQIAATAIAAMEQHATPRRVMPVSGELKSLIDQAAAVGGEPDAS